MRRVLHWFGHHDLFPIGYGVGRCRVCHRAFHCYPDIHEVESLTEAAAHFESHHNRP